jgi:hypothetical protein
MMIGEAIAEPLRHRVITPQFVLHCAVLARFYVFLGYHVSSSPLLVRVRGSFMQFSGLQLGLIMPYLVLPYRHSIDIQ